MVEQVTTDVNYLVQHQKEMIQMNSVRMLQHLNQMNSMMHILLLHHFRKHR